MVDHVIICLTLSSDIGHYDMSSEETEVLGMKGLKGLKRTTGRGTGVGGGS